VSEHRAGVVALLGRPNAGKSTLLNRLLGQKLAIVTAKPQTTRSRILGISNPPGAQILWLDTPGLHEGGKALNRVLNAIALAAAEDCDLALLLVDPARGLDPELAALRARLVERGAAVLVVATKADLHAGGLPADLRVSAQTGEGIDALLAAVVEKLPLAPPYYDDPDQLTDRPLRWLAAECVREAVFEELEQELPYATAVEVESFDESRSQGPQRSSGRADCAPRSEAQPSEAVGLVHIRAQLLVERASQKRIVVGAGGEQVKRIGIRARAALEALLGSRVHLELWVKVEPDWPKRKRRLDALGYR
jgi:GTP-binding protein Era